MSPDPSILSWCEVSADALKGNIADFRHRLQSGTRLGIVVKSNAYGHGLIDSASVLEAAGADWLIVNSVVEAQTLRQAAIEGPVYLCGPMSAAQAPLVARHADEVAVLVEREEAFGSRGSGRSELVGRQKRELRRLRDDELRFGLATLSRVYRDSALVASGAGLPVDAAVDATARITSATGDLVRNPNETLLLQALFLDLPMA